MEQRLQKLLAAAGAASRRNAEDLITSGRVSVNGEVITKLGSKADPDIDIIEVDGRKIDLHPEFVYILLNKPKGYTSTRRDPHAKRIVTDLIKDIDRSIYPVGRLDVNTEGLILLTNDGDFTFRITHPKHNVPKTYNVTVFGLIQQESIDQLANGVLLDDRFTTPAKIALKAIITSHHMSILNITIKEGRKRQIRRMLEAVGHPVIRLVRTRIGNIHIGKMKPGEWRFLTKQEVDDLLTFT